MKCIFFNTHTHTHTHTHYTVTQCALTELNNNNNKHQYASTSNLLEITACYPNRISASLGVSAC